MIYLKDRINQKKRCNVEGRLGFVDLAKSIGIFCVVLAHTQLYEPLQNFIYVFHMPLFFFISGYLFSYQRNSSYKLFVRKRSRQLLAPYVLINLIAYVFWLLIARHYGDGDDSNLPVGEPLLAAVSGNGGDMVHDVPLWFLLCIFLIEMIYYPLFKKCSGKVRICLIEVIGTIAVLNYLFDPILLPFSFGTVLTGMVLYALGHEAALIRLRFNRIALAAASVIIVFIVAKVNGRINMHILLSGKLQTSKPNFLNDRSWACF